MGGMTVITAEAAAMIRSSCQQHHCEQLKYTVSLYLEAAEHTEGTAWLLATAAALVPVVDDPACFLFFF